jgi:hypothetical protein
VSGPDELLRQIADFLTIIEKKMIPADAAVVLATALVLDCRTRIAANAALAARCGRLDSALREIDAYLDGMNSPPDSILRDAIRYALASQAEGETG